MKHFTKYLPVEGEIKVGDKLIDSQGNGVNKVTEELYKQLKARKLLHIPTIAKLFLCSRDIQVGDKVWDDYPTSDGTMIVNTEPDVKLTLMSPTAVKVIGEVSPEAIWVTEGMEFSEDEFRMWWKTDMGWSASPLPGEPVTTFMKCPTCKTYH